MSTNWDRETGKKHKRPSNTGSPESTNVTKKQDKRVRFRPRSENQDRYRSPNSSSESDSPPEVDHNTPEHRSTILKMSDVANFS
jgi:hypothetical protein